MSPSEKAAFYPVLPRTKWLAAADLVFDPTLAGRDLALRLCALTPSSRAFPRGRTYT